VNVPEDKYAPANGLQLNYKDWGGSGQQIVLVHGLASSTHIWHFLASLLSEKFRVVAVNQRGHGESDKPDTGYDFANVATDLKEFIQAIGFEKPVVVGHSWGGNVAVQLAADNLGLCKGLCLVDGGTIEVSSIGNMSREKARQELAPPDFTGMTMCQMREHSKTWDFGFDVTQEKRELILSIFEQQSDGTIRPKFSRENHLKVIDAFWEHKPSLLYDRIDCPVLITPARRNMGAKKPEWETNRDRGLQLAEKLLHCSKQVWLEDSVHDVPLQRPELLSTIIADHIIGGFFD
jgi:pimeloyl-ACP methyl ester carboxylesterase